MLKKIFLSICAIAVIVYLSLWAWAVHWIDEEKNIVDFVSEDKNRTLETAKLIWQITPAIDRNKDAERLLKMAEWSVYTDLTHNIAMLKNNYNTIAQYHKKHENKLNEPLKSRFILQKLIFMNRSFQEIKDKEFEQEIYNMIVNQSFYGKDNLETRIEWLPEFMWFILLYKSDVYNENNAASEYGNLYENYKQYFADDLISMNKKYNYENTFNYIYLYNRATLSCYLYDSLVGDKNVNQSKLSNLNNSSRDIFKLLQYDIKPQSKEFEILDNWMKKNSHFLMLMQSMGKNTECSIEALNFFKKM